MGGVKVPKSASKAARGLTVGGMGMGRPPLGSALYEITSRP
jgi:hypothetical protein